MTITVLGIDPGISNLGYGVIELNPVERSKFKLVKADTIMGKHTEFSVEDGETAQTYAKGLMRSYEYILDLVEPNIVGCEDNFLGLSPSSFKRLIEVVSFMNFYTTSTKAGLPFTLTLPRLAKKIVDADKSGGDKDLVLKGLKACKFLDLNGFDLDILTEHALDGILIALYNCVQYYKALGWDVLNDNTNGAGN